MRPHHMHTMPSSFTACFCLLLSSKSERIKAIALYSLADGRAASTLLFLCIVSLLLKPHVRAFLLPFLLSPTGDQGSFPSSLPRLATTSSLHHTLCSGWWEAEPAFGFCHLHWGKPVFLCSWGPWGGEAKFTSWFSAEMPRHSHTALAAGTVLWVYFRLGLFDLVWFGLVGKEEVGWSNPCGPWVTLLVLYSSTWCFSLALSASPAHAAGGVGALSNAWLRGGVTEALPRSAVPSGTQERLHHQFLTFSHLEQLLTCWVYHVLTQPTKAWY